MWTGSYSVDHADLHDLNNVPEVRHTLLSASRLMPCANAQGLLTGAFSGGDADLHARLVAAFRSNVYWQQYSQCHWAPARACGNVTCAEKEGHG